MTDKLHDYTLDVARSLLNGENYSGAAYRRAVSSAYYALFQRLSSLCASRLSGQDPDSDDYVRLYRALEHRQVRTALNNSSFRVDLGARFAQLQDARHWADYRIEPHPDVDKGRAFSAGEAQLYVDMAYEALQFVDSLDSGAQLTLAVLLIVRAR